MSDTAYKPRSAWRIYQDPSHRTAMAELSAKYLAFLTACKTERQTVAHVLEKLRQNGYTEDVGSGKAAIPFREKCLFVWKKGVSDPETVNLIAAHADSPRLDFKQHPFMEQAGVAQARTHYYGGIRKYQWLGRPLALHGVIIRENGEKLAINLGEEPGEPVFTIADLLPHLAQKQQDLKLREAFEAEKLNVILGHEPESSHDEEEVKDGARAMLLKILSEKYELKEEDLITAEIEVVPAGPARFVGIDQSLIGGYGQDDRICVFCALDALLSAPEDNERSMALIFWDKEEIGSDGATGASSRFFQYCMEDAASQLRLKTSRLFLNTRAISADVSAALDPDYQDVHEKQNAALMGYGPVFSKFTGSRGKYGASEADAEFFASLRRLFNSQGIPWQAAELGKVDLGGGGTVALFLAAYGINVIDLGPALLSMHSPFELASVADLYATRNAYQAFLKS